MIGFDGSVHQTASAEGLRDGRSDWIGTAPRKAYEATEAISFIKHEALIGTCSGLVTGRGRGFPLTRIPRNLGATRDTTKNVDVESLKHKVY